MAIFRYEGTESKYAGRGGQPVLVLADLYPLEYDPQEVGTMFLVRFADGFIGEAFGDELDGDFILD